MFFLMWLIFCFWSLSETKNSLPYDFVVGLFTIIFGQFLFFLELACQSSELSTIEKLTTSGTVTSLFLVVMGGFSGNPGIIASGFLVGILWFIQGNLASNKGCK